MQRPWMPNQHVTDLQRDGLEAYVVSLDSSKRVAPLHAMRAWRNLNRAMLLSDSNQPKADDDGVRGKRKVRNIREERTLIVNVGELILRAAQRHVAAPLVGDDPIVHQSAHDAQHIRIEKELRRETWRLERHRQEVAMRTAIRGGAAVEIREQAWPERLSTCVNEMGWEMFAEDAIAAALNVGDRVLNRLGYRHGFIGPGGS